jgi:integration host factor subunit alpha
LTKKSFSETNIHSLPYNAFNYGAKSMSLTKAGIVQAVTQETGLSKCKSADAVESVLDIMRTTLASGEDILISGFGKFCVREKAERRGRNPATGGEMMLPARRVVTFKCSGKLRNGCNGG